MLISAYGQIAQDDVATVRPEAPVGGSYAAKIVVVDRVLDSASGTFGVRLELSNEDRKLPAGARCRVGFPKVKGPTARPTSPAGRPKEQTSKRWFLSAEGTRCAMFSSRSMAPGSVAQVDTRRQRRPLRRRTARAVSESVQSKAARARFACMLCRHSD